MIVAIVIDLAAGHPLQRQQWHDFGRIAFAAVFATILLSTFISFILKSRIRRILNG